MACHAVACGISARNPVLGLSAGRKIDSGIDNASITCELRRRHAKIGVEVETGKVQRDDVAGRRVDHR
jgi:hypothetical protein